MFMRISARYRMSLLFLHITPPTFPDWKHDTPNAICLDLLVDLVGHDIFGLFWAEVDNEIVWD